MSLAGALVVLIALVASAIHPLALALVGATVALLALSQAQDRQMSALDGFHDDVAGLPDPNP
ncbi:MAG: hypothetical protein HYS05_15215 [Acidobacteria bacterium]|nr:hypothetical protein [Acidobacteriota bacterium]